MLRHLRANLWLLALTLLICSVLYPLALWAVGQTVFHSQAEGSLVSGPGGTAGSRLIGQPFSQDKYFWPRPSATTPPYNAAASGASNYGASNPALRERVLLQLGPLITYADGQPVGPDIVTWFRKQLNEDPKVLARWFEARSSLPEQWVKASDDNDKFVADWATKHPELIAAWQASHADPPKSTDLALLFFQNYSATEAPPSWFSADPAELKDLQSVLYPLWREAHAEVKLKDVPADLVTTSGSGLDPHISLDGALYQLRRVVNAWVKETNGDRNELQRTIKALLHQQAEPLLGGLVGAPVVNVLEVNRALRERMDRLKPSAQR